MSILDADIDTDRTPVETDGGIRFSPALRLEREPSDLLTLYEREHARADRETRLWEAEPRARNARRAAWAVARAPLQAWSGPAGCGRQPPSGLGMR